LNADLAQTLAVRTGPLLARSNRHFETSPGEFNCCRLYGAVLLAGHALCFIFLGTGGRLRLLLSTSPPICWPFFENCWRIRFGSLWLASGLLSIHLALVVVSAALWRQRRQMAFRVALLLANLLLAGIVSLDYRYRQNQFYMYLIVIFVFLGLRDGVPALRVLIVLFYFWAGSVKLNYEWLSGAVIYRDLWGMPAELYPILCAYVVVLELVLVFGLLARARILFWGAAVQIAVFHLASISQVGWFYPAIMATILSIFPLARGLRRNGTDDGVRSLLCGRWPPSAYVIGVAFSLLQLLPELHQGDRVLTGEGHFFALHMFEARQECTVSATFWFGDGRNQKVSLLKANYPPRMMCDPVIYYNLARNVCRERSGGVTDLDLEMRSKRRTDHQFKKIIDVTGFCRRVHDYVVLGNNWWLSG
jgi:hypothetical protein